MTTAGLMASVLACEPRHPLLNGCILFASDPPKTMGFPFGFRFKTRQSCSLKKTHLPKQLEPPFEGSGSEAGIVKRLASSLLQYVVCFSTESLKQLVSLWFPNQIGGRHFERPNWRQTKSTSHKLEHMKPQEWESSPTGAGVVTRGRWIAFLWLSLLSEYLISFGLIGMVIHGKGFEHCVCVRFLRVHFLGWLQMKGETKGSPQAFGFPYIETDSYTNICHIWRIQFGHYRKEDYIGYTGQFAMRKRRYPATLSVDPFPV